MRSLREPVPIVFWSNSAETRRNWGDALNPLLVRALTGRMPIHASTVYALGRPVYALIGSVLKTASDFRALEIWGSGLKSPGGFRHPPRRVHAVRGPLTRQVLLNQGVKCPQVFGDPALLYPRFFSVRPGFPRFRLGLIPHYFDQEALRIRSRLHEDDEVCTIDILAGIEDVANQVASCAAIASSSLHGLVLADALGIPNVRLKITDRIVGGDFKYRDYFESVGRRPEDCVLLRPDTTVADIEGSVFDGRIDIDLDALLACCPLPRPDG